MKSLLLTLGLLLCFTAQAQLQQQHPADPSCQRQTNLVMVHGFGGSADTWLRWNELLQGDAALSCVNAYTFSYQTGVTSEEPGLEEIATSLRAALSGIAARDEDLFLVAHSMGGLVIKRALLQDLQAPTFLPHLKQVFFIASPHAGIRRPVALFVGVKSPQVKELRRPKIRALRRQWEAQSAGGSFSSYPVQCSAIIGTKDRLVPRYSAKGGFDEVLKLPKGHVEAKNPDSVESPLYQSVKTALLASLQ